MKVWTLIVVNDEYEGDPAPLVGKTQDEVLAKLREQWATDKDVPDERLLQAVIDEYHVSIYGPDEHDLDPKPTALEIWKQSPKCNDSMCTCNRTEG